MTHFKPPCMVGCKLPGRYALVAVDGSAQSTVCGRHVSHALDLLTRNGPVRVTQVAGRNYR